MRKLLFALIAALTCATALASGSVSGVTITQFTTDGSGNLGITLSAAISGGPSCATSTTQFVIPAANVTTISSAQLAFAMGASINATGNGTCSAAAGWTTTELIASITVL